MENKAKLFGIILTALFHAGLLLVCTGSGLKYIYPPPEEQAMLMEFPDDDLAPVEMAAGIEPRSPEPDPEQEVKLVQKSEGPVEGKKLNEAEEATVGDDGDVEVPEQPRPKEINKRALFTSANNNKKDTLAPQTADKVSDALAAGHAQGNTRTGATDGAPSAKLAGRTVMGSLPLPGYEVQESGRVVVAITVDREGNVTSAIPGAPGTSVSSSKLREAAKQAALKAKFNISEKAPASQEGTITYIFTLK
jgi:TonB family C-terminal domain